MSSKEKGMSGEAQALIKLTVPRNLLERLPMEILNGGVYKRVKKVEFISTGEKVTTKTNVVFNWMLA